MYIRIYTYVNILMYICTYLHMYVHVYVCIAKRVNHHYFLKMKTLFNSLTIKTWFGINTMV